MHQKNYQPPGKPRYEVLDGLRGVAALIVVAFHLLEVYSGGPVHQIINHGYLAVDFFFILSGYVVGYAYDNNPRLTAWNFAKRRLVRLHPMVVFGSLLGALLFYFQQGDTFPPIAATSAGTLLVITLVCCTLLPLPPSCDIRGWAETNPLNGPAWSLQFEYLANILYFFVLRRLPATVIGLLAAGAAILTIDLTMNLDIFNLLGGRGLLANTVVGGWCITEQQCYIGLTRLLYPFLCGLLLSRTVRSPRIKGGFLLCSVLLVTALAWPRLGGEQQGWQNGLYEAGCILLLFPTIIVLGAGSTAGRSQRLCRWLGEISYPLYLTHYPLVYLQTAWANAHPDAPAATHAFVYVAVFALSLLTAYACMRLYDIPIRAWLRRRYL